MVFDNSISYLLRGTIDLQRIDELPARTGSLEKGPYQAYESLEWGVGLRVGV